MPTSNHAIELIEKVIDDKITAVIKRSSPKISYGTVTGIKDGVTWVSFPGNNSAPITRRVSDAEIGETVKVTIYSDGTAVLDGSTSSPTPTATGVKRVSETVVSEAVAPIRTRLGVVEAETADIKSIRADSIKVRQLTADELEASVAYINDLTAENITARDITSDHATIANLDATYASIETLEANYAHMTNGVIDNATISYADVDDLNANYAAINLANVNNAWVQNGIIRDAAITNEMVHSVSANKLTAGTIDASNINVTNLRADTLVVNKLNGQPVIGGYAAVDSSTSGYSSMNPSAQGWYEISNGNMVLSQDTSVNAGKAYYTTSTSISLYDQAYIDSMEHDLNDRIDGAIETFTGSTVPTLSNYPASDWTTNDVKDTHVGDVYFVVNSDSGTPGYEQNGYNYRFTKTGSGASVTYSWQLIKDSDVTNALSRLSEAEGSITQFSSDISTLQTDTGTLTTKTQSLETSLGDKVDVTTFNSLENDVETNKSTISSFSTVLTNNGLTASTNITSTVNEVSQTATGAATKISQLTQTLGTNADGTTKAGDIVHRTASVETGLTNVTTRVGKTEIHLAGQYATSSTDDAVSAKVATILPEVSNWELSSGVTVTVKFVDGNSATSPTLNVNGTGAKSVVGYDGNPLSADAGAWREGTALTFTYDGTSWRLQDSSISERISHAETAIKQTANNVLIKATSSDSTAAQGGQHIIQSLINVAPQGVTIDASHLDITGTAVFNAINNDTGTTQIDGGKINATNIIVGDTSLPNAVLRFKLSYAYDEDPISHEKVSATFTAHLYRGTSDIKTSYPENNFTWWLKSENWINGEPMIPLTSNGDYTCTVDLVDVGYGATIVGRFNPPNDAEALTQDDDTLTDNEGTPIAVRTPSGDYVRVADLEVEATVFDTDKLLVVGAEDEHLVTVSTLKDIFGTASYENLDNLPSIEGVTLVNNKSFPDLGIFRTDSQGYSVSDDYTLTTMDINALWANAQPIGG